MFVMLIFFIFWGGGGGGGGGVGERGYLTFKINSSVSCLSYGLQLMELFIKYGKVVSNSY